MLAAANPAAILISDWRGFIALTDRLPPPVLADLINRYLTVSGTAASLAARLPVMTRELEGSVVLSETTYRAAAQEMALTGSF